jgi:hypothetical protein
MNEPIHWRGFALAADPDEDASAWRYDDDDHYLGVAREDDGSISAIVEVGFIEGEGTGATTIDALDAALLDVRERALRTKAAVDELLARPR